MTARIASVGRKGAASAAAAPDQERRRGSEGDGRHRFKLAGLRKVPAGMLIDIPANAAHTPVSTPDEDVIFNAIKDLSRGIIGKPVDGTMAGLQDLKGFGSPAAETRRRTR